MHSFPLWFDILMTVILSPISWIVFFALIIALVVLIVKRIKKRRSKSAKVLATIVLPPDSQSIRG